MQMKKSKEDFLSIKVDMSKAYDRVKWLFLRHIMKKLGFDSRWINKVMMCVESVTYKLKINGQYSETFVPGRGLRQGDPLSPYIFLICQEWFSTLLIRLQDENRLEGIKMAPGLLRLNNLLCR